MEEALSRIGGRPCILDAQAHLVEFYRGLGFAVAGPEFLEDDIPHVPMRRVGGLVADRPPHHQES